MQGKTHDADHQPMFGQDGERLTWFFRTGRTKGQGRSIGGVTLAERRFGRETDGSQRTGHWRADRAAARCLTHRHRSAAA
jgi:hypothetical protein